jgi:hypothetical protein
MTDRWTIRGPEYVNCNCDWGCPCQFNAPTTHGFCEALGAGRIDEGHFDETRLDGLGWVTLFHWPGEIAAGNGTGQVIIDERADADQRAALRRILHGEATAPGATHFAVFASTLSRVLETLYAPIEVEIDVDARKARVEIAGLVSSEGLPITNPHSGEEYQVAIHLPRGFEYTTAEVGRGRTRAQGAIRLDLHDSHGHFAMLHMNQDGVIR